MSAILVAMAIALQAQAIGDPRSWIIADDYPEAALTAGAEGPVRAVLSIDKAGSVVDCMVDRSSGNAALDAATCTALRKRAKFIPARNGAGVAIASKQTQTVRWAIPRDQLISRGARMTYTLNEAGQIMHCKIDEFGGHDPDLTCSAQMVEDVAGHYLSKPLRSYSSVALLMAMEVKDGSRIDVLRSSGNETVVITQANVRVSPAGVITACESGKPAEYGGRILDLCHAAVEVGQREFEPDTQGRERSVSVSFEITGQLR